MYIRGLQVRGLQALILAGAFICTGPASAQKAKDTVRIGFYEPIGSVLIYDDPQPQNAFVTRAAFDTLICYAPESKSFVPSLAKAWRQPDDKTLEFDLRDDVKFHDGAPLTAEDVAYTLNWLIDPASPYRFKENFSWVKEATVVSPLTVRIAFREINPTALSRLATSLFILPKHVHEALADKATFGRRTPIGTGPYRVAGVDLAKGIVLTRATAYPQASPCKPAATVNRIEGLPMPDVQTQAAQMITGGLDVMRISTREAGETFEHDKRFVMTSIDGMMVQYISFDAANRSGNPILSDVRVRRALVQAIDRQAIATSVTPGQKPPLKTDALCFPVQIACAWNTVPPAFDRAAAKKLLVEAGYPNGFELELTAFASAAQLAEAIAGEFHKIGVRAKVSPVTLAAYRQKQRDGKLQAVVALWTSGGLPDSSSTVDFLFAKGPRDFSRDGLIHQLADEAMHTNDEAARKSLYARIYDRVNEQAYVLPISGRPDVFVHLNELNIGPGSLSPYSIEANEFRWK
ncbi:MULTISPECIES: ABC transporter substrate-binding protein [unclassified Beijerinckia]|uniref:ABC transporter substrate-binding protein n=1 Tax=unclassified Beijerinckia TaxID=2638183 RepID=UPI0008979542|nr:MULTISPECIES: ABC transporter substrate-binding protein [unclassified Beijerinckia]MDH7797147.1 peptide/nickel transport system substrate-binding protein [Beijerinckia sp. GAS462]SEC74079.1 peptide/nickel transport system substrate-binding protein [Beijerinckia sp. 28-YEA-48]